MNYQGVSLFNFLQKIVLCLRIVGSWEERSQTVKGHMGYGVKVFLNTHI